MNLPPSTKPPAEVAPPSIERVKADPHFTPREGEALVRLVESASAVSRRSQFFVWSQGPLSALLPHQVLLCGAYSRGKRGLSFVVFHSVVVSPPVLASLTDADGPLMSALAAAWVQGGGRALAIEPARLPPAAQAQAEALAREVGSGRLLVHGVARPQRPAELESLFVLTEEVGAAVRTEERLTNAERVMPYLHATWRRVEVAEATMGSSPAELPALSAEGRPKATGPAITERERQILRCARDGKSNLEIGLDLHISALTVKNHIQKILRKLGASNRAHAVALAMSRGLL